MPLVRKSSDAPPPPPPAANLNSSEPFERWAAARALTQPSDVAVLGEALVRESAPNVREAILTSLCRIATPASAGAIVPMLRSEDAGIRRGALDALISMPNAAAPHLASLLSDADPDVRLLSCEIVRSLPADDATALLAELLTRETMANVAASAIDVLTEIGTPAAAPALQAAAARFAQEPFLQFAVQSALERIAAASAPS